MYQMNVQSKAGGYTLAGNQMRPFERIVVASSVDAPDTSADEGQQRVSYRAPRTQASRIPSIRLPWALLLIMLTVVIMLSSSMRRVQEHKALQAEFEQLQNKYTATRIERDSLQQDLNKATDSSFVSYYAVQKLGMSLALNEETVQVQAPDTRPALQGVWTGRNGGQ